jgi:hypothetical protein
MYERSVPLPCIDQVVDLTVRSELLSFLDAYSGYHHIPLAEVDQSITMFINPFGCFCYVKISSRQKNTGAKTKMYVVLLQRANRAQVQGLR